MPALGSEQSFAALGMNDCYADEAAVSRTAAFEGLPSHGLAEVSGLI